jgi:hypothetical protein
MSPKASRLSAIVFCIVSLAGVTGASAPTISRSSAATPSPVVAAVETPAIQEPSIASLGDVGPTPTSASAPRAPVEASAQSFADDALLLPRRQPSAGPAPAPTPPRLFSIDLYRKGAFASQATTYYCVPAAIELMMNMISGGKNDTSRATQDDLYRLARAYLIAPFWGRGAQPEGWARVLNAEGDGRYAVAIRSTRTAAIHLAARQLRLTGKPVGILAWAGNHAWVMSGFESIGDPATGQFTVTGLFIEDVWWPRPDTSWGPSPRPDRLMSVATFARYFLPYDQHGEGGLDKDGKFVVVIPLAAGNAGG